MKKKYQNGFFIFGLLVFAVMLTQIDYRQAWQGIQQSGSRFVLILLLWAVLYGINTTAWMVIIKAKANVEEKKNLRLRWLWLYKTTITGFAINYATPGGLMGGEPYRIMALKPYIGTERASSSVILYVMTHIFAHLWFWLLSAILFIVVHPLSTAMTLMLGIIILCSITAIWFFMKGYQQGLTVRATRLLKHIPYIGKKAQPFIDRNKERFDVIDQQIAALHQHNKKSFVSAVMLELAGRFISALEIYWIAPVMLIHVGYADSVLILAFTSLFANLLFFLPLQLGGREGGFLMSATNLGLSASAGGFIALMVRLRELIWTGIGLLLIKWDRSSAQKKI